MDIGFVTQPERTVWFDFPGEDDVKVLIRYMPMDERSEIERQATVEVAEKTERNAEERLVKKIDEKEYNRLYGRAAVRGWEGLKDKEEDFPFSQENCDLLMTKWAEFSLFVGTVAPRLHALVEAERKAVEKKSETTSGQGTTSQG